ncbi:MAG: hypothetical protein ACXIUM_03595 [Wenzhouxiangella sp.]
MQTGRNTINSGERKKRALMLAALVVIVSLFWVVIMLFTNLPTMALAGIGLISLVLLALATAWTAMAFPSRG